jgi:hypothetical protein
MKIQNIYVNDLQWINVDGIRIPYNQIQEFDNDFKNKDEFKRLIKQGFIKEVIETKKK